MNKQPVLNIRKMDFNWDTIDPFLFCVHHHDHYPAGNETLGPRASLAGRVPGQDFTLRDGWRMYHGERVPGFPSHPHRGFETVTVVLKGFVDHSDSHGAAGRYGQGDVQWMTAGAGLQHAEMFPLLDRSAPNELELFQIWLNLPRARKLAPPHYRMLWAEDIPHVMEKDQQQKTTEVTVIAGKLGAAAAPDPAPDSWAADPGNEVAVWLIRMEQGARWTLPPAAAGVRRTLYFYRGGELQVAGEPVQPYHAVELLADRPVQLHSGGQESFLLLLQGRPIAEPVAQYGPFVMNEDAEIHQAFADYRRTQFGGWPWKQPDPVHPPQRGRFARFADGTEEVRPAQPGSATNTE